MVSEILALDLGLIFRSADLKKLEFTSESCNLVDSSKNIKNMKMENYILFFAHS